MKCLIEVHQKALQFEWHLSVVLHLLCECLICSLRVFFWVQKFERRIIYVFGDWDVIWKELYNPSALCNWVLFDSDIHKRERERERERERNLQKIFNYYILYIQGYPETNAWYFKSKFSGQFKNDFSSAKMSREIIIFYIFPIFVIMYLSN